MHRHGPRPYLAPERFSVLHRASFSTQYRKFRCLQSPSGVELHRSGISWKGHNELVMQVKGACLCFYKARLKGSDSYRLDDCFHTHTQSLIISVLLAKGIYNSPLPILRLLIQDRSIMAVATQWRMELNNYLQHINQVNLLDDKCEISSGPENNPTWTATLKCKLLNY